MKDHKEDFATNLKVRLIKPAKPEIGRIAMKIIDNVVKQIMNLSRPLVPVMLQSGLQMSRIRNS